MSTLLSIRGLSKSFALGGRRSRVLQDVDLHIRRGECLGLVGESGCGKTTLALCALHLLPFDDGEVTFDGQDLGTLSARSLRQLRQRVQMVFQNSVESMDPRLRVGQAVAEPILIHGLLPRSQIESRVNQLLADVGLAADLRTRYPHQLSGGQRQRLGIARALATNPQLVIFDEPVSALDVSVRARILDLLKRLRERYGLTMMFISHDLPTVAQVADRIAVMYAGRVVEVGDQQKLCRRPRHPYTADLFAAAPVADPRHRRRRGKPQVVSKPSSDTGCPYLGRCQRKADLGTADVELCQERPSLRLAEETSGSSARSDDADVGLVACHYPLSDPRSLADDDEIGNF